MKQVDMAAAALRAQLANALAASPDEHERAEAMHGGLAAALGLLASVLADDAEQVTAVGRLMEDLQSSGATPESAASSLCLLIARHALGARDEAARAIAAAWQQHRGEPLAAAARLVVLTVSWLDTEGRAARSLGRAELALEAGGPPMPAMDAALRALCDLLAGPPPATAEPALSAFEAALTAACQAAVTDV